MLGFARPPSQDAPGIHIRPNPGDGTEDAAAAAHENVVAVAVAAYPLARAQTAHAALLRRIEPQQGMLAFAQQHALFNRKVVDAPRNGAQRRHGPAVLAGGFEQAVVAGRQSRPLGP